jgi:hypothetical protein
VDPNEFDSLDDFIEAALKSDAVRSVPLGFRRRIEEKVRVLMLIERERRRFRNCVAAGIAGALALVLSGAIAATLSGLPGTIADSVPGARGYYDFVVSQWALRWPGIAASAALTLCIVVGALAWSETRLLRRRTTA